MALSAERNMTLQHICLRRVSECCGDYSETDLSSIPTVILAILVDYLGVRQLLRLHSLLTTRGVAVDPAWQKHVTLRWRDNSTILGHGTFLSNKPDFFTQYINTHVEEIFASILDDGWWKAWYCNKNVDVTDACDVDNQCHYSEEITVEEKCNILNDLKQFAPHVTRVIVNCRYNYRLHPYWLIILRHVKSIRLVGMFSSSNCFNLSLTLLHSLRSFGNLQEIDVSHSKEDHGYEMFAKFCACTCKDEAVEIMHMVSLPDFIPRNFLDVCFSDAESTYSSDSDIEQGLQERALLEAGCENAFFGTPKGSYYFSSEESSDEEQDLYDTALLEPLDTIRLAAIPKCPEISRELERIYKSCMNEFAGHNFEPNCYSAIKYISCQNSHLGDYFLKYVDQWSHLTAYAIYDDNVRSTAVTEEKTRNAAIADLISREQFTELHVSCNIFQTHGCGLYHMVTQMKRITPLKNLHLSCWYECSDEEASAQFSTDVDYSAVTERVTQDVDYISVTERVTHEGDRNCRSHAVMRLLAEHDRALRHYEYSRSNIGIDGLLGLLESLQRRAEKGYDLQTLDLCATRKMGQTLQQRDFFLTRLSPLRIQTLVSLNLAQCQLNEMTCLTEKFLDDILCHRRLRELYLSYNVLEEAGCTLIEKITAAIIKKTSKIQTLDVACNRIPGQKLNEVALKIAQILDEKKVSDPPALVLDLSHNHLTQTPIGPIVGAFGRVFKEVKNNIFDFSPDLLEHVALM